MTPELESRIRALVAHDKPLLAEQGKALLEALDECAHLMAVHLSKRAETVRFNLKQRAELKEYAATVKALEAKLAAAQEQIAWMRDSIAAGSP